jgi:hypothetical protein
MTIQKQAHCMTSGVQMSQSASGKPLPCASSRCRVAVPGKWNTPRVGRHPIFPDDLAYKIAALYSQWLLWQHGQSRHYYDRRRCAVWPCCTRGWRPRTHCPAPSPTTHASNGAGCAAAGLSPTPYPQGLVVTPRHHSLLPPAARQGGGPRIRGGARPYPPCTFKSQDG